MDDNNVKLPSGMYQVLITNFQYNHKTFSTFIEFVIMAPSRYAGTKFSSTYSNIEYQNAEYMLMPTLESFGEHELHKDTWMYLINKTFKAFLNNDENGNTYIKRMFPNDFNANCEWSTAALMAEFMNKLAPRLISAYGYLSLKPIKN